MSWNRNETELVERRHETKEKVAVRKRLKDNVTYTVGRRLFLLLLRNERREITGT